MSDLTDKGPMAGKTVADDGSLNPDGDQLEFLRGRCGGCGLIHKLFKPPGCKRLMKFRCAKCEYVTEIETFAPAMDTIEGHIEEGEFEERMKKRKSVQIIRG